MFSPTIFNPTVTLMKIYY